MSTRRRSPGDLLRRCCLSIGVLLALFAPAHAGPIFQLEVTIDWSPEAPAVGQKVAISAHVKDTDGAVETIRIWFGDGAFWQEHYDYGLPTVLDDRVFTTPGHSYKTAGEFTVAVYVESVTGVPGVPSEQVWTYRTLTVQP